MSIDIAKLKAAAEKAKEYGGIAMYSKAIKANAAFKEAATPAAVLELIAALEAKDVQIAELDERLLRYAGIATRRAEHVAELEKRIAELEARTLTVKLPPEVQSSNIPFAADGANAMRKEVVNALTDACAAAGISLKIEGE